MDKKKILQVIKLQRITLEDLKTEEVEEINTLETILNSSPDNTKSYFSSKKEFLSYFNSEEFLSHILTFDKNFPLSKEKIKQTKKLPILQQEYEINKLLKNLPSEYIKEEIKKEKRRRNQAYKALDYYLSMYSFYDFFSHDSFDIITMSKLLAQKSDQKYVKLPLLFLSFYSADIELLKILNKHGFNIKFCINLYNKFLENDKLLHKKENFLEKVRNFNILETVKKINFPQVFSNFYDNLNAKEDLLFEWLKDIFVFSEKKKKTPYFPELEEPKDSDFKANFCFSSKIKKTFTKSAINAMKRFKTPVITPEILFITIMEDKNSKMSELIKKQLKDEITFYVLRFKLLKRIHRQETSLKNQVPINQYFFAYLLKIHLPESSFQKLINENKLKEAVSLFRHLLIKDVIKADILKDLKQELKVSIASSPKRYYSF